MTVRISPGTCTFVVRHSRTTATELTDARETRRRPKSIWRYSMRQDATIGGPRSPNWRAKSASTPRNGNVYLGHACCGDTSSHEAGLVYTARTEAEQASRSPVRPLAGALPEASISSLRTQIRESEGSQPEDAYQARACLAQGLWAADSRDEVLQLLKTEIPSPHSSESKERRKLQGWTYVTAIRSAYLKGELSIDPATRSRRR